MGCSWRMPAGFDNWLTTPPDDGDYEYCDRCDELLDDCECHPEDCDCDDCNMSEQYKEDTDDG